MQLLPSAELYIINSDQSIVYGPVTCEQNIQNGVFLTDLIPGDSVTIYLYESNNSEKQSTLEIPKVVHAYRQSLSMAYGNLGGSESCNNDIACYPAWADESNAVALVLLASGNELCSGSLLISADKSFRPFFLTAFHCIDTSTRDGVLSSNEILYAQSWMFKFQYKKTSCKGTAATLGITYNGATFRAAWYYSDFALMELSKPLDSNFTVLGWDRSSTIPTSGASIHHPAGDAMKISFENHPFQISTWNGLKSDWLVFFDSGVVQPCSSGAPLFNQDGRVVGQLQGNQDPNYAIPYCQQPRAEYGRFDLSWTGGNTSDTQLSHWLNPNNSQVMTTNTTRVPTISGPTFICANGTATYVVNNAPSGPVSWTYSSTDLKLLSTAANTATFQAKGSIQGNTWIQATFAGLSDTISVRRDDIYTINFPTPEQHGNTMVVLNGTMTLTPPPITGITNYRWNVGTPSGSISDTYGATLPIKFSQNGTYSILGYGINSCGESLTATQVYIFTTYSSTGYSYASYPNPTGDLLNIEIIEDTSPAESARTAIADVDAVEAPLLIVDDKQNIAPDPTFDIRLYNDKGSQVRQTTAKKGGKVKFNVSNLPSGTYFLHIYDGIKIQPEKRQIIVKH